MPDVAGLHEPAERAYEWLVDIQLENGSWWNYYLPDGSVEEAKLDTNVCAYIATGVWHHWLCTWDRGFVDHLWPTVQRAVKSHWMLQGVNDVRKAIEETLDGVRHPVIVLRDDGRVDFMNAAAAALQRSWLQLSHQRLVRIGQARRYVLIEATDIELQVDRGRAEVQARIASLEGAAVVAAAPAAPQLEMIRGMFAGRVGLPARINRRSADAAHNEMATDIAATRFTSRPQL
mgnify:CR=1 FL=1